MKAAGIILLLLVWHSGFSQWTESFGDGEFTSNPSWTGNTIDYVVEDNVLRLLAPPITSISYLSVASTNINDAEWHFSVRLDFNPSASNYTKIYLVSDSEILDSELNGYFIKLGGTADEVSLYRQDGLVEEKIIDGADGRLSLSEVIIEVITTRTSSGAWELSSKLDNETTWNIEGEAIDNTYVSSSFFGVQCVFTSTRSTKFYFDNITVSGTAYIDTKPPVIDTAFVVDANHIKIEFDEVLDTQSTINIDNFLVNNIIHPSTIEHMDNNILLSFSSSLAVINKLTISNIADKNLNVANDTMVQVIYVEPVLASSGDIVINEVMADPTPREDLPEIEYLELFNSTDRAINMTNWSFSDKISTYVFENLILLPDSFLILTPKSSAVEMSVYGSTLGLSTWPSLNNSGDSLVLLNEVGELVDLVDYSKLWYNDDAKDDGGWSLERINPDHPCSGIFNWHASMDVQGGSPGKRNSVFDIIDNDPPQIISYNLLFDELIICFNEPILDSLGGISVTPDNLVESISVIYNKLNIKMHKSFEPDQTNEVSFSYITDCLGNGSDTISISFIPDFDPPKVDTVYADYPDYLEIYFNEEVVLPSTENFYINQFGAPAEVLIDVLNRAHVTLVYKDRLVYNTSYTLLIESVEDINNNTTNQSQYTFTYRPLEHAAYGELLITEIMADPSPAVNLPEVEYLELTNMSGRRLLLQGLILADTRDETTLSTGILEPDERVILTKTTAVSSFAKYGYTIGVANWPTLNNLGDVVSIFDPDHGLIHNVSYTNDWYDNMEKEEGGWSLELIDVHNFCGGDEVWSASINNSGGTPGKINSTVSSIPDLSIPVIEEAYAYRPDSILIRFSEALSNQLPFISLTPGYVQHARFSSPDHREVLLNVELLESRTRYLLSLESIIDCAGNINDRAEVELFLPEEALPGDVIISEVLFNPVNDGVDFIEVYNVSAKHISLYNWQLRGDGQQVSLTSKKLLAPYSFKVFTEDPTILVDDYPKAIISNIYQQSIPTMVNLSGSLGLRDYEGLLVDSIHYDEDWHFPYLASIDGVSLERIDFALPGNISSNWASAPSTENYATPGYGKVKSSSRNGEKILSIKPQVIVPNANGRDDFAIINLSLNSSGALATITIYNLQGQIIKVIANNLLVSGSTLFKWDGTDINGAIVPLGHYIIVAETISDSGSTEIVREKVVVATGY